MIYNFLLLIAGIGLLLAGIFQLGTVVQTLFSLRLREYIKYSVKKPIYGAIIGFLLTILAQSSSTTSVLTIGLVNAGIISFYHSLSIFLGANIGTSLTPQFLIFKFNKISPLFIFIGVLYWIFGKEKKKIFGEFLFYFGLIFFGFELLSKSTAYFKNSSTLINSLKETENAFFGVLIGTIFTLLIQASAVTVSILIFFAQQGLISTENALPIVLGANLGTTIDAILASIGGNINAKRSALSHVLFKFFGVILFFPILNYFKNFLNFLTFDPAQQIALFHILFNIFIFFVFFFILKPFSEFLKKIIPGEVSILPLWPEWLNSKYLKDPSLALSLVNKELERMLKIAQKIFLSSVDLVFEFKNINFRNIQHMEHAVDNLQHEIAKFLDKISEKKLNIKEGAKLLLFSAIVDDIERIADQSTNIAKLARYKANYKVEIPLEGKEEIIELRNLLNESINESLSILESFDYEKVKSILKREELVDELVRQAKEKHFQRFFQNICEAEAGPIFNDILVNLERISDHCVNIAEYLTDLFNKYNQI
jgi:phosphate:Na+ symporter